MPQARQARKSPSSTPSSTNVYSLVREMPADLLTPVSAFLRLAEGNRKAFLLESVEGGERWARYSFLGADPVEELMIEKGRLVRISRKGGRKALRGNPFFEIGEYLSRYRAGGFFSTDPAELAQMYAKRSKARSGRGGAIEMPPFMGGAVGFIGYGCVRHLEPSRAGARAEAPKPEPEKVEASDAPDAHLMVFRTIVAFDHLKQRVLLISSILTEHENFRSGLKRAEKELLELERRLARQAKEESRAGSGKSQERPPSSVRYAAVLGKDAYVRAVKKAKSHIRDGDIFQCVLSDQFRFDLPARPFEIYRALRRVSPAPYLYYLSFGGDRHLLGASPEMLARVKHDVAETCPIAGTRPRGGTPSEDRKMERQLLESVKEKAEHLMLVDLSRNDLGRVCEPGTVRVPEFMQVHRFSHVMHLVSTVLGKLGVGQSPWQVLASCFPAGTLSGAPKIRAMEIIADLEPVARGVYGGAVVYSDFSGTLDSCITIRSLYAQGKRGWIQAGAGIVADSSPEKEYAEVGNKTRAIRRAVALAAAAAGPDVGKGGRR